MKFWKVKTTVLPLEERIQFTVQAPDNYSKDRIVETLGGVHPEYKDISAEEIDRPDWAEFAYGEADSRPPRPRPSEAPEALQEEA